MPDVAAMSLDEDSWSPPPHWASSKQRAETLLDDLQLLIGDLCVEWGFCGALADDILAGDGMITADHFANAILMAEGSPEPRLSPRWRDQMTRVFEARYGASISVTEYEQRLPG